MKSGLGGRPAFLLAAASAVMAPGGPAHASEGLSPTGVFVQAGIAEQAQTLVFGGVWDWGWRKPFGAGLLTGYWELSFGRWSSQADPERHASAWVTQLGVTPVLRWHFSDAATPWFLEAGIGANLLAPIYRTRDKSFSTTFNFGDHLAIGRQVGFRRQHEWSFRVQHYSNAGIKHPNPGENFLQLRYVSRF
jgi:lipid A 3-O-deacylase